MSKKVYITPLVTFDEIEEQTGVLGTASVQAEDQPWGAKAGSNTYFCVDDAFEDPFEGPIEEANEEFEYSINQNW